MKMGIVGLPQSGKSILFSLIAGRSAGITHRGEKKIAVASVHDQRLDKLHAAHADKKKIYAHVEFLLVPSLTKDPSERKKVFPLIAEINAVLLVVRAFQDETVYHIDGTVDPLRDVKTLTYEMICNDLDIIERRLGGIEKDMRRGKSEALIKEKELLMTFQKTLEDGRLLGSLSLDEEGHRSVRGFNFLTLKPLVILLNVSEDELKRGVLLSQVMEQFGNENTGVLQFCAAMEKEISELESEEEKKIFLGDLGLGEAAIDRIIQTAYKTLGYISFFTVGDDEVRAWTIHKGSYAPQAAGVVHTDMERGFIRAEVIHFQDFVTMGSESECRKAGKEFLKGKDYIVEDGDILKIRFSV